MTKTKNSPAKSALSEPMPFRLTPGGYLPPMIVAIAFLVQVVVFKIHQTTAILGHFEPIPFMLAVAPDAAFILLFALPFAALFSRTRGAAKLAVSVPYHLLSLSVLLLYAASHGYFQATGANLSLSPIEYALANAGSTGGVVASEISASRLALLLVQPLFVVASALAIHLGPARRRLDRAPTASPRVSLLALGFGLALGGTLLMLPSPRGPVAAVARSIPGAIGWEFLSDRLLSGSAVEIGRDEVVGTELVFKKTEDAPRPNIVFILFESLAWKHSDVYAPGKNTTPFLEKLSRDALIVDRMYTTVPHTTKAVLSALCGIYPYFETTPKEAVPGILPKRCLAHMLKTQGYETAFFQPAYNFERRDELVYNMGYDEYRGLNDMPRKGFESMSYFGAEDKMMLGPSMDWVASVKDDGPFLLTYLTLATHHNYAVPQSFPYIEYDVEDDDLRNYMNAVRYVDSFIEEVFDAFEQMGLMDDTLFIIAGDHGEGFFEHGRRQHDLVIFEEGLRVAALLYGPGFVGGPGRIEGVRSNLDWVPTVADLLGLELEAGSFVGSSLLEPVPTDRKLFHSCWFQRQCMAMREGDIKTIYFFGLRPMEVYDNRTDPFDERDLAFTGSYDDAFLERRKAEMLRQKQVVDQQFEQWEAKLSSGRVTKEAPPIARRVKATFGGRIELLGVDVSPTSPKAGGTLEVTYVFKCIAEPKRGDNLFVHVLNGGRFINADHVPVGGEHPVEDWQPGDYIVDEHSIRIPKDWQGDEIELAIGFWNKRTKKRLPVTESEARMIDNRVVVATLPLETRKIRRSAARFSMEKLREKIKHRVSDSPIDVEKHVGAVFGDKIQLLGYTPHRMDVELAGTVEMTYVFKALEEIPPSWRLSVRLVGADGAEIDGDHVPLNGLYPLRYWQKGEHIADKHMIHIDMYRTRVGTYRAYLGFRAGSRPVPVTLPDGVEVDDQERVYIGEVVIRKDHDPHLRR